VLAVIVTLSFQSAPAWAQQVEENIVFDIAAIDCRSMLKMASDEQDFTLIYFHGYKSGQAGVTMFDAPALLEATEAVMDFCIDNPSATLLEAFDENR
jgi:hypothetical protein